MTDYWVQIDRSEVPASAVTEEPLSPETESELAEKRTASVSVSVHEMMGWRTLFQNAADEHLTGQDSTPIIA